MIKLALCIAYGAAHAAKAGARTFARTSRAAMTSQWLRRTLASWKGESDTLPTLNYEPLDVGAMELPPGWRGYGAKDYVDHPDTPARAAEVAALRERMANAPRFDVQQALMPYEEMLPAGLRGRNERIDEPFK